MLHPWQQICAVRWGCYVGSSSHIDIRLYGFCRTGKENCLMNRVVLCGRLAGPPKLAYTATGTPVAELRLLVPRVNGNGHHEEVLEEIDCVAFRTAAVELAAWGGRGHRLNLEGRLRFDRYR